MKRCTLWTVVSICLSLLAGCANQDPSAKSGAIPAAKITDARYDPATHEFVVIDGEYFKAPSESKLDVITSLDGRDWKQARKIISSGAMSYKATIPYGPEYPNVWVRVYGMDGQFSQPYRVHN